MIRLINYFCIVQIDLLIKLLLKILEGCFLLFVPLFYFFIYVGVDFLDFKSNSADFEYIIGHDLVPLNRIIL